MVEAPAGAAEIASRNRVELRWCLKFMGVVLILAWLELGLRKSLA
jgi:hypothetical protein